MYKKRSCPLHDQNCSYSQRKFSFLATITSWICDAEFSYKCITIIKGNEKYESDFKQFYRDKSADNVRLGWNGHHMIFSNKIYNYLIIWIRNIKIFYEELMSKIT